MRPSIRSQADPWPWYKNFMKITEQWLLYKYESAEFTILSEPFKTRKLAEKARLKLPEGEQREVAVGMIRPKG